MYQNQTAAYRVGRIAYGVMAPFAVLNSRCAEACTCFAAPTGGASTTTPKICDLLLPALLDEVPDQFGRVFTDFPIVWPECGIEMAVNIEFADDFASCIDRHNNL